MKKYEAVRGKFDLVRYTLLHIYFQANQNKLHSFNSFNNPGQYSFTSHHFV